MRMLELRVENKPFLLLVKKWLKARVLNTDGKVLHPVTGTPQGGIISPLLANVYLHYVLDLWFKKVVKPRCRNRAYLIRYADDFVCAFEREDEARWFREALEERLKKFKLALSAEKTRVIAFDRVKNAGETSFDFLGFEFRWGTDRKRKPNLKRRTSRKKLRNSRKNFMQWCRENRHQRLQELFTMLNAKLRGYYNYYGVIGNCRSLNEFYSQVRLTLFSWLNRRSQRRSYRWETFEQLLKRYRVPTPHITQKPRTQLSLRWT